MTDRSILDYDRYKDIARLVLDDDVAETDPSKSVVAQLGTYEEGGSLEWQIPGWFAPLVPFCEALLDEHPNFSKNVFVTIRSEKDGQLDEVYSAIKEILSVHTLNALRANERHYTNQVWDNVRTHMLCCRYGIAVLESIAAEEACPNVALEYGFMNALNRPTMLLVEEKHRKKMRDDITGAITYTFKERDIRKTTQEAVRHWIKAALGLPDPGADWQNPSDFDVFLAHNSQDKLQVQAIAEKLKQRGMKPWLDVEQIPPGRWFQDVIQEAIREVKSAAILIGPSGLGKWQAVELQAFISECVGIDLPVIPVLLPGVDKIPSELSFLRLLNWVDFKDRIDDTDALDHLEWGITGEKPNRNP